MKMVWDETINDYMVYGDEPLPSVKEVEATPDYKLHLTFKSGERKIFDMKPMLERKVFSALKDAAFFAKAHVKFGTVVWSDEVDIAPEILYEDSVPA